MRVLLLLSVLALAGCAETGDWRQRLTLYIRTPSGPVVASSVIEAAFRDTSELALAVPDARRLHMDYAGEAVVADLGEGRYLFALLTGSPDGMQGQTREAYRDIYDAYRETGYGAWIKRVKRTGGARRLPPKAYPTLVSFADIADPASVFEVNPTNLAAAFGPGFALQKITLEVTRDPVTEGRVEVVLPCLTSGKACIPLNKDLPYGHPMRNILNSAFRDRKL